MFDKNKLYLMDKKISFKRFKELKEKAVATKKIKAIEKVDKTLWELLKAGKVYCGFRYDLKDDMWIGNKIPKGIKISYIK